MADKKVGSRADSSIPVLMVDQGDGTWAERMVTGSGTGSGGAIGSSSVVTVRANYAAAQTNQAIASVSAGSRIVVTGLMVTADNANTVDVGVVIGFAAVTTPTTTGVLLAHPGIAPGSGVGRGNGAGILGIGADGEDVRITSEVSTSGSIDVVLTYYTVTP